MPLKPQHLIKTVIFISFQAWMSSQCFAQQSQVIDYHEALSLMLKNNPTVNMQQSDVQTSENQLKKIQSMALPKLDFSMNSMRTNNPLAVFGSKLSQRNASFSDFGAQQYTGPTSVEIKPTNLNQPGFYSNFNKAFTLSMPLFTGGRINAFKQSAYKAFESSYFAEQEANNQMALALYQAYEGVRAANQLNQVAVYNVLIAKQFLDTTKQLLEQSITFNYDVLMAENYLMVSQNALSQTQMQIKNSISQFRLALGMPNSHYLPGKEYRFQDKVLPKTKNILSTNASLQAMHAKLEATAQLVKAEKAQYLPQVQLQLQHEWNGGSMMSGSPSDTVGLAAKWQVLSFGERSANVEKANAEWMKTKYEYQQLANELITSLRQTIRAENQFNEESKANKSMVAKGKKVVSGMKVRFGRGLVPLSALIESQIKVMQAQTNAVQADFSAKAEHAHQLMLASALVKSNFKANSTLHLKDLV